MLPLLTELLKYAYPFMGFVALLAYIPQFKAFVTNPAAAIHAPLTTWCLWTAQCLIFFLYAVVVNKDPLFIFTQTGFFIVCTACLLALLYGRHGNRGKPNRRITVPPKIG